MLVLSGIRNFLGVLKSSVRNHPLMSMSAAVGLKSSTASVGGGLSVCDNTSVMMTAPRAGTGGSLVPGDPLTRPLGRQLDRLFQRPGSACSSTVTREKPNPSVMGYQELL